MIVDGDVAVWSGGKHHEHAENSREELTAMLLLLENVAGILLRHELLLPTELELEDWVDPATGSPSGRTKVVRAVEGIVPAVLAAVDHACVPTTVTVRGLTRIVEPTGVDYVLEGLVTLTATQSDRHLVWIKTHCDAWLPQDLLGAPQPERHRLNAPRLERALAEIQRELSLNLLGTESKYAVVHGYQVRNRTFSDGDVIVPDDAFDATEGDCCSLLLHNRTVVMSRRLRAGAGDEVRLGYRTTSHADTVLITFTQEHVESHESLTRRLALDFPGIAPLRSLGENESDAIGYADVLIEELPRGRPAIELAPIPEAMLLPIGLAAAEVVASVHAANQVVLGIRPELIYLSEGEFAALVPRGPVFIASAPQRAPGLRSYAVPYDGFEALALGTPAGKPGDIFALCATLQHLATGRHPFGEEWPEILQRVVANAREPYPGSKELDAILARGMDPDPGHRPTAQELAKLLAELSVTA